MRTVYATTPHRLRRRKSRRGPIVSWCPWVASPCVRVKNNLRLIDAVGAHPSPQSSPLQQGERQDKSKGIQIDNQRTLPRRGNRITFVLSWRSKKGQYEPASSSLGVSRELHLTLFPQGPIATRACGAKTQI